MRALTILVSLFLATLTTAEASAAALPHLQRNGQATELMVDGAPYIVLGGELHNSSPSSPAYMAPIWDRLARNDLRTVIGVASWELVEPQEGTFDFTAVDDEIRQAHAHGMHLVLIWFGAYKNGESTYAPTWVRRDVKRFPRAIRAPNPRIPAQFRQLFDGPAISVFGHAIAAADARAFAALMHNIREVDPHQTVILIQVENETGLLGDSMDRSPLAQAAWKQQVPARLIDYLQAHRAALEPPVAQAWTQHHFRKSGTWAEVFGRDTTAHEIFMAWHFARYVDRIARAGAAQYPLPMYTNAWLGPQRTAPAAGMYPSGGPVAGMIDVWKAGAPAVALLAPDTYVKDFVGVMNAYHRADNPIFIAETYPDVGNLFLALGDYDAIGYSPFGIDGIPNDNEIFKAYGTLNGMRSLIARAQSEGRIRGVKLDGKDAEQKVQLGGYDILITGPMDTRAALDPGAGTAPPPVSGCALILKTAPNEFLIVGQGVSVTFSRPGARVEIDSTQEGIFRDGVWTPGRTLNGDERNSLFPRDSLRIVRIHLLKFERQ